MNFWIATFFGAGLLKPGPGTWGTVAALPFGVLALYMFGAAGVAVLAVLGMAAGYAAIKGASSRFRGDDQRIVIDEAAGIWIALIPCALTIADIALAFIVFRALDIAKPWPISWLDRTIKGPAGIMIDDAACGILTALLIIGLHHYG